MESAEQIQNRPVRLAVFDMDGTILDTLEDLHDSVDRALDAFGFPLRTMEEVRLRLGKGMAYLVHESLPEGVEADVEADVLDWFRKDYGAHCLDHTRAYDGIRPLLARLRRADVRTAVLSNKGDYAVQELIRSFFPGDFDFAAGERAGIRRKPAPDAVLDVMDRFGMEKADTVYIGDSEVDLQTGRNAGTRMISVLWGFRPRDFLEAQGARVFAETPDELGDMILRAGR